MGDKDTTYNDLHPYAADGDQASKKAAFKQFVKDSRS